MRILCGVLAATTLGILPAHDAAGAPPASRARAASTTASDPGPGAGTTAFSSLPVDVRIERLSLPDPSAAPEGELLMAGILENRADGTVEAVAARIGIGRVITSRTALAAADASLVPASRDFTPPQELALTIRPGESVTFEVRFPAADISASVTGAYPIRLLVEGLVAGEDAGEETVGAVQTFLPWFSSAPVPDRVAWVWPLVGTPDRGNAPDDLADDTLPTELAPGGRLHALADAATTAPGGALTAAVDPALLQSALEMSDGYRVRGGPQKAGDEATAWLAQVRALAATQPVMALPYADMDVVAAVRGGLGADVTAARSYGSTLAGEILAPPGDAAAAPTPLVAPPVSWPPDEVITQSALDVEAAGGVRTALLSSGSLPATPSRSSAAVAELGTPESTVRAVTVDRPLSDLVAHAATYPGGDVLALARIQAEMAVLAAGAPDSAENLVIVPPRRWAVPTDLATSLFAVTTTSPWAAATTVPAVAASGTVESGGSLAYPQDAEQGEVAPDIVASVAETRRRLEEFLPVLDPDEAAAFLGPYREAGWLALSSAWRTAPDAGRTFARDLAADVASLGTAVSVVSAGTYTVSGPETTLPLTISNTLPVRATVRVAMSALTGSGFTATDPGPVTIEAQRRLTVAVAARSERPGRFTVQAQLTTPEGIPLGSAAEISVRSTVYGDFVLGLTVGALALFVGLVALRFLRRRSDPDAKDDDGAPEGTGG